ncbi:hypothetical protein LJR042_000046 [Microbacterium maritypicum]|uniref:hypothetical protein n=1 Tax=Microbacterium maritypicum TaxID=33918 RepID=UPI003ECDF60B
MTRRNARGRTRGDILAWLLIVLLFVAPLASLIVGMILLAGEEDKRSVVAEPVFATITEAEFVDAVEVTVAMGWSPGVTVKAPSWSGLVTEIGVAPGDAISAGTKLIRVDGVWRVAAPTSTPFYSPVTKASSKSDVAMLNSLLRSFGLDAPGDSWKSTTLSAIRQFALDIGVPDARSVEAWDPAWVLWTPFSEGTVGSVAVSTGQAAPSMGEDVIVGPPQLASASITAKEGLTLPSWEEGDQWVLRTGDISIPVQSTDLVASGADLSTLARALGSTEPEEAQGVVEREVPIQGWQVPVSAVHTDVSGALCVFRGGASGRLDPVVVEAQRGTIGTTRVFGELKATDQVLVNVSEIARSESCG